jgi:flagellar biogenesis protein FliO
MIIYHEANMKLYRFLLFTVFFAISSPILAETPTSEQTTQLETPAPTKKDSGPKYFLDVPDDRSSFEGDHFWKELVNMFITLGLIILVLVALVWIMRRMQTTRIKFANESSYIKLVDHRALSAKSAVYLLHIQGRAIIVSDSQNGMTRLADFPIDEQTEETESPQEASRFESIFQKKN